MYNMRGYVSEYRRISVVSPSTLKGQNRHPASVCACVYMCVCVCVCVLFIGTTCGEKVSHNKKVNTAIRNITNGCTWGTLVSIWGRWAQPVKQRPPTQLKRWKHALASKLPQIFSQSTVFCVSSAPVNSHFSLSLGCLGNNWFEQLATAGWLITPPPPFGNPRRTLLSPAVIHLETGGLVTGHVSVFVPSRESWFDYITSS